MVNLDLFELLHANCSVGGNFKDKLYITTLAPLAILAFMLIVRAVYIAVMGGNRRFIGEGSSGGLKQVFMLLYFLIPMVATTVCQTFAVR